MPNARASDGQDQADRPPRHDSSPNPDGFDDRYVYSRAEDRSLWMRSAFLIDKYKLLWGTGVALLVATGYGWHTPAQTASELRASIETTRLQLQHQVDTLKLTSMASDQMRGRLEAKLDVLLKLSCSDPRIPPRDKRLAGLDCPEAPR